MKLLAESDLRPKIDKLLARVWKDAETEGVAPATSIGLHLYGHGGEVSVLLNMDDDESFQAEAIEYFDSKRWGELTIPELEGWVTGGEEFEFEKIDGTRVPKGQEAYEACFWSLVDAAKAYISNLDEGRWRPNFFVYEDSPVLMDGGLWNCPSGIPLPPRPAVADEPVSLNGFRFGCPDGLKVYSFGFTERKYCGLYLSREGPELPERNGIPIFEEWPMGVKAHAWATHKRKGHLARVDSCSFAINRNAPAALKEWLCPFAEFLPIEDEDGQGWEIVHLIGEVAASPKGEGRSHCKKALEQDRDGWMKVGQPIFRGSDGRDVRCFIIVDADPYQIDFLKLAHQHDIRGVQFELFWCEDTVFLRDRLHAAAEQIRDKAEKYSGSRELTGPYSECWTERDFGFHQLDRSTQDHTDLKGKEGWLSANLWHYYKV